MIGRRGGRRGSGRTGMTLVEVIIAMAILGGAMLGLANFGRKFQHATQDASNQSLASDLATQRIEEIQCAVSSQEGRLKQMGSSSSSATYLPTYLPP